MISMGHVIYVYVSRERQGVWAKIGEIPLYVVLEAAETLSENYGSRLSY